MSASGHMRRSGNVVLAFQVGGYPLRTLLLSAVILVICSLRAPAEVGVANDVTRVPELQKLDEMIGVWDVTGVYRTSQNAPLFSGRGTFTVFWSPSRRAVISDQHELSPYGWIDTLFITTWNEENHRYQVVHIDPTGKPVEGTMEIEGNTRRMVVFAPRGDRAIRAEVTVESISEGEKRFRVECADQGDKWIYFEGAMTKRPDEPAIRVGSK
jgi:hypothetical protein